MGTLAGKDLIKLDHGRLRVCGDLLISINRSWQVDVPRGTRPVAAFKSIAPTALLHANDEAAEGIAALAPNDAYWLGFETTDEKPFAVCIHRNGVNLISGNLAKGEGLLTTSPNFLVLPDQPWLDSLRLADGNFEQLIPVIEATSEGLSEGSENRLEIEVYRLELESLAEPEEESSGPKPLYSQRSDEPDLAPQDHPWDARSLTGSLPDRPCAKVNLQIVDPTQFEKLSGTQLDLSLFEEADGEPPAPFNPFGGD